MEKTPAETLIRHRQYRELFETFTLFFSLALLLLRAGTLMIKIQAPPLLIAMPFVFGVPTVSGQKPTLVRRKRGWSC
jgi:hypothetical protein